MAITHIFTLKVFKKWRKRREDKLAIDKINAIAAYLEAYGKLRNWNSDVSNKANELIKSL